MDHIYVRDLVAAMVKLRSDARTAEARTVLDALAEQLGIGEQLSDAWDEHEGL